MRLVSFVVVTSTNQVYCSFLHVWTLSVWLGIDWNMHTVTYLAPNTDIRQFLDVFVFVINRASLISISFNSFLNFRLWLLFILAFNWLSLINIFSNFYRRKISFRVAMAEVPLLCKFTLNLLLSFALIINKAVELRSCPIFGFVRCTFLVIHWVRWASSASTILALLAVHNRTKPQMSKSRIKSTVVY